MVQNTESYGSAQKMNEVSSMEADELKTEFSHEELKLAADEFSTAASGLLEKRYGEGEAPRGASALYRVNMEDGSYISALIKKHADDMSGYALLMQEIDPSGIGHQTSEYVLPSAGSNITRKDMGDWDSRRRALLIKGVKPYELLDQLEEPVSQQAVGPEEIAKINALMQQAELTA